MEKKRQTTMSKSEQAAREELRELLEEFGGCGFASCVCEEEWIDHIFEGIAPQNWVAYMRDLIAVRQRRGYAPCRTCGVLS